MLLTTWSPHQHTNNCRTTFKWLMRTLAKSREKVDFSWNVTPTTTVCLRSNEILFLLTRALLVEVWRGQPICFTFLNIVSLGSFFLTFPPRPVQLVLMDVSAKTTILPMLLVLQRAVKQQAEDMRVQQSLLLVLARKTITRHSSTSWQCYHPPLFPTVSKLSSLRQKGRIVQSFCTVGTGHGFHFL